MDAMAHIEKIFISEMRKKFQDERERKIMMMLMIEEIRLSQSKEQNKMITYTDSFNILSSEMHSLFVECLRKDTGV